jgi:hypothetical protein
MWIDGTEYKGGGHNANDSLNVADAGGIAEALLNDTLGRFKFVAAGSARSDVPSLVHFPRLAHASPAKIPLGTVPKRPAEAQSSFGLRTTTTGCQNEPKRMQTVRFLGMRTNMDGF